MKKVYLNFIYNYASILEFENDSSAETLRLNLSFATDVTDNICYKVLNGYEPYARFICVDYTSNTTMFVIETKCKVQSVSEKIETDYTFTSADENGMINIACLYSCIIPPTAGNSDVPISALFVINLLSSNRVYLKKLQLYKESK